MIMKKYFCPSDNLIYDNKMVLDVKTVKLESGQKVLERGTVISFSDIDGNGKIYDGTDQPNCILCDDVDTGETAGQTVIGAAYRTGHFTRQALITGDDTDLSAEHISELEKLGIYLSNMVQA